MKILHIANRYAPSGGVETYIIDLLPLLESDDHHNTLIYRHAHPRTLPAEGRSIFHIPITEDSNFDRNQIADIIQIENPDIIYLHDVYDPDIIGLSKQMAPTVGYVHIFYPVCPGLAKLFRRGDEICTRAFGLGCVPMIYFRRCASARHPRSVYGIMQSTSQYLDAYRSLPCVIVASKYMKALMIQNGFDEKRVQVLPYFVPIPDDSDLMSPDPGNKNVLFAGRLDYEKGLPYLIDAFKLLPEAYSLTVAGDGSLKQKYVQLAKDHGVSERVQFNGWLSDGGLKAAYQKCRVAVMPTIMPEPFGKVGVEAMANGRPVIAFDVGGIPDWLKHGYNGFLVPPRDVKQLAIRINQLADDVELTMKLGRNGRNFVQQHYSVKIHLENLIHIFDNVIELGKT